MFEKFHQLCQPAKSRQAVAKARSYAQSSWRAPSLSPTPSRVDTHTYTHTYTHTHTRTYTHILTYTHIHHHAVKLTGAITFTNAESDWLSLSLFRSLSLSHTHTHTYTHRHARTHTHIITQSSWRVPSLSPTSSHIIHIYMFDCKHDTYIYVCMYICWYTYIKLTGAITCTNPESGSLRVPPTN